MNGGRVARGLLLARTVKHLRPAQVAHRVRLTGQRAALGRLPEGAVSRLFSGRNGVAQQWPPGYVPLDGRLPAAQDASSCASGRFCFLNRGIDLGTPPDWAAPAASRLWRFHLHYFEWAWSFALHPNHDWAVDAFAGLVRSWRSANPLGHGDAWSPYVASLRAWSLCGVHRSLVAGSDLEPQLLPDLGRHAAFLRAHLELDVGGNHLLKNLKALYGLGVFLDDDALVRTASAHVERQLGVQVLADGGHFERSPSYHCQVLGDLIDLRELQHASGRPALVGLDAAVAAMRRWLGAVLMPDGDVPLFNDCTLVGPERVALLEPSEPPDGRLTVLRPSGYVVMRAGQAMHVVADAGPPCPPELPAHAHADCLSFEMAVHGRRLVVDTGTSTYESGARRQYERSTAAHNTVDVDGEDQTEVWSTFRAARRALPDLERAEESGSTVEVTASHDGYERLHGRPRHRRTWEAGPHGLVIVDTVTGGGRHRVRSSLHLLTAEPDRAAIPDGGGSLAVGPLIATCTGPPGTTVDIAPVEVATDFGILRPAQVLTTTYEGELPVVLRTALALAPVQ